MILELGNWSLGYSQILADCRPTEVQTGGSALILANADVDSIAAARILSYMLRADNISYQLQPCMSYRQLERIVGDHNKVEGLRAIVLLNLGSNRNLTRLFDGEAALDPLVKVYVMDYRRPVHLANYHAGDNIVLFWDSVNNQDLPSDGDNLSGNESSTDEDEDSDDSDDDDDSDGDENEFADRVEEDDEQEFEMDSDAPQKPEVPEQASRNPNEPIDYDGEDERDADVDDDDDVDELAPSKRRRKEKRANDFDSIDSDDDDNNDDDPLQDDPEDTTMDGTASTAPTSQMPTMTPREMHQDRRNRVRNYYATGTFFGSPAAFVAYRVATQLRFGEIGDLLWLACVGVTDAYLHSRLDVAGYSQLAINLRGYCQRLFPNDMVDRVESSVYAEHLLGGNSNSGTSEGQQQAHTRIGFSENGKIVCQNDYRFFLLRHTSLLDAMVYSDYVSTRFQLSTTKGMHKLRELLAKMGYPLEECQQPFAFMKPSLRRRLQTQFGAYAEEYGLENFEFTSFFRVTGYNSLLSASDTSYAVTALLECESSAASATHKRNKLGNKSRRQGEGDNDQDEEEDEDQDQDTQDDEEMMRSFTLAYDALNSYAAPSMSMTALHAVGGGEGHNLTDLVSGGSLTGQGGIGAGIRWATWMQKTIITTAASLVERQALTRLSHFRYAYVNCTSQGEKNQRRENGRNASNPRSSSEDKDNQSNKAKEEPQHIFAKPLALSRLAHYLMDLHRENGKWTGAQARPLILLAENPRRKTYLVVGHEYPETAGSLVRNRFGKNFELAAQSMQGNIRFDSFDSNIVEVAASDALRFVEQLHYLLDSV